MMPRVRRERKRKGRERLAPMGLAAWLLCSAQPSSTPYLALHLRRGPSTIAFTARLYASKQRVEPRALYEQVLAA